jgi:hypothetical protein
MRPYFISSFIFVFPLLLVYFFYTMDVSYLTSEVEKGGTIAELMPPEDVKDLTDVTLLQSCIFVVGMPCILCIQVVDIAKAVRRSYRRHYNDEPLIRLPDLTTFFPCLKPKQSEEDDEEAKSKSDGPDVGRRKKRSTLWQRICRTCWRCFRGSKYVTVNIFIDSGFLTSFVF